MRTVKQKLEPNQDDASDYFFFARRLHTRPNTGSNDRFLLLKPFILPNSDFGPIFLERIPKEFQFLEEFLWNSKEFQKPEFGSYNPRRTVKIRST